MTGASDRRVRLVTVAVGAAGILARLTASASAQDISVNFGQGNGLTERVVQLVALLTVLSLAPSILVMMTSFTRIVVAVAQKNVREKDLKLFVDMVKETEPSKPEDLSLRVLVPAFIISELKRAFEIGFLLFLPFLIIDLVGASVLCPWA